MAHDFPVPDEAQLERLIVSVYKRLPDPEFPRLNRIEERLARNLPTGKTRRKANTIPWWIVAYHLNKFHEGLGQEIVGCIFAATTRAEKLPELAALGTIEGIECCVIGFFAISIQ